MTKIEAIQESMRVEMLGSTHHVSFGSVPMPPNPPVPPYANGDDPTTWSDWPPMDSNGNYEAHTVDDKGFMDVLLKELSGLASNPGSTGNFLILLKTIGLLSQLQNKDGSPILTTGDINLLNQSGLGNLLKDGIDQMAMFSFLYGYGNQGQGPNGVVAFAQAFYQTFVNIANSGGNNAFVQDVIAETQNFIGGPNLEQFLKDHTYNPSNNPNQPTDAVDVYGNPIQVGDMIWEFKSPDGKTEFYDWTAAMNAKNAAEGANQATPQWATNTLQMIESSIENGSGVQGGPNPDIDTLDAALNQMEVQNSLSTFDDILKTTGDVGLAILAFIYQWEGYNMNSSLSGPASVMDKEKKLSQLAKQIEDQLKTIGQGFTASQMSELVGNTLTLFNMITQSGQLANGLGAAVASAEQTFQTTMIAYPPGQTTTNVSLWDLYTRTCLPTNDPNYISPTNAAAALQAAMVPPPSGGGTDSGSTVLQGVLGGYDGLVTAVSSNSTAEVTESQQGESTIQAMDKIMTGVTDKNSGMNTGVISKIISNTGS